MSVRLCSASTNARLWRELTDDWLGELGMSTGPRSHGAFIWLTHRIQRDALYEEAARRALPGWLAPPIAFFSDLPELFAITQPRVGLLRRRALIGQLAREQGSACGIGGALPERAGVIQALDTLFGELLPEGVTPDRLEEGLDGLDDDEFARCRNVWVVSVYRGYLDALAGERAYDPRQIHAIVAQRIADGALPEALGGARKLHIYGLTSLRTRVRLVEALAAQSDVEVKLYLPTEDGRAPDEGRFGCPVEWLEGEAPAAIEVKPAPDSRRELDWVACEIKQLLLERRVEPEAIAVVARTGREDTRPALEALRAAGIPTTARIRTTLSEVPALKAILHLFRGAATGWRYRPLRAVLESAYFDIGVDLWPIDYIAAERRVDNLELWAAALCQLQAEVGRQEKDAEERGGRARLHRDGITSRRMARACETFDAFRLAVASLCQERTLVAWIGETQRLLSPGLFGFRERACRFDGYDYEIVRLDQQAIEALRRLLSDWGRVEGSRGAEIVDPAEWYARLRRFLEQNEITFSTPRANGVRILEAHEAALFPFEHVFVIHANDGEFPKAMRPGGLFSEEEREQLAEGGLPLSHREAALRRERALWRAVTQNPNVVITYRTADLAGTPLLPSLLVPGHSDATAIERTKFLPDKPVSVEHQQRQAARAMAESRGRGTAVKIEVVGADVLRHAVLNAFAETQRGAGDDREAGSLGPWNGELRDPWVLHRLERDFGDEYRWSASKLESYGSCPFLFLVGSVLRLDEREEAEEETTRLISGIVAHQILERFYGSLGPTFPDELDGTAEERFDGICDQVFDEREQAARDGEYLGVPALWAVTKASIRADVKDYVQRELPHMAKKGERPVEFEYAFGFGADFVQISGLDARGRERTIGVCGKIDRVDEVSKGKNAGLHILDYKSGGTPEPKGYDDGSTLQIPLYMKVLAEARNLPVTFGRYRSLADKKGMPNHAGVAWGHERFESALKYAFSIPARVRAGMFEAKAAAAGGWRSWDPGIDVCRTRARHDKGRSRFDE